MHTPKTPPEGKAYACPYCGKPLTPHDGPWDILHCFPCQKSIDLWWAEEVPELIDIKEQE